MLPPVFCTFKWDQGFKHKYTAAHVNTLAAMVARHYQSEHRFVCITDDKRNVECETVPLWPDHSKVKHSRGNLRCWPSCYRRLKLFSKEIIEILGVQPGQRIISLDLDVVVLRDIRPMFDRSEPFVGWIRKRSHDGLPCFNGSIVMVRAGQQTNVWDDFDPEISPKLAHKAGYLGSDQAWLSYVLEGAPHWKIEDGPMSFSRDLDYGRKALPSFARIVVFHGPKKPWGPDAQQMEYVRRNYKR